ncbi:hypothetical protein G6F29_011811 [Rhizopus arrhizus]|nr:hypothetical protein G6F29_011811 [Rhizopus arrhizus]KAG1031876.1 hypothetical protein G6F25_011759 [Rhizopus arrhizus]KAG1060857.1 hypothetical protein G6F41_012596 [Rhizopus arrhizus]
MFQASYALHTTYQDIADGETAFNSILIYPFLRAVSNAVADEVQDCKTDFKDGEAQLQAMIQQLKASGLYKNDKFQYKADGLVKMYGVNNLEILLLETSYHFGSKDKCKAAFDHHKGLFGSLSMLKTIADCFSLGTMESFQKVKVFFTHAAGTTVYLWSLRFEASASLYEFWLEDKLTIKPSIKDKSEALPDFVSFRNYFFSTHNDLNKYKKYNMIVNDYITDLDWILQLENIPDEIREYASFLRDQKNPSKAEMKADEARPKEVRNDTKNNSNIMIHDSHGCSSSAKRKYGPFLETEETQAQEMNEEEEVDETCTFWKDWVRKMAT